MDPPGRQLDWSLNPIEAIARWPADRRLVALHSGRPHPRWSRYTVLAEPVAAYQFNMDAAGRGRGAWHGPADRTPPCVPDKPFTDLRALYSRVGQGLWIGYLGYDLGRWIEQYAPRRTPDRGFPIIELLDCPDYLLYDNVTGVWHVVGDESRLPDLPNLPAQHAPLIAQEPSSVFTQSEYEAAVARALRYIGAGDIFQVNLTQRFTAAYRGHFPLAQRNLFTRLMRISPAWYGAYIELWTSDDDPTPRVIASTSPELFLEVDAQGNVVTRPIKGTRPASVDPAELLASEKDAAELHMIVDLLRNDLGRVCDYGSVRVVEPRIIESHPTVHHGVATITGRLHPQRDIIDLLRAAMPGGSITGAPKIRAMQIIEELEPVMRGPYCGCIGYLARDRACFNIAIRTIMLEQISAEGGRLDYSVGGGIVADSDPGAEYQETLDKAAAMQAAIRAAAHTDEAAAAAPQPRTVAT